MLNIGLLGVGHLGKIHLKCIQATEKLYNFVGFYDPNSHHAAKVSNEYGIPSFSSLEALLEQCDVVDIVTPTVTHYELAQRALHAGKHLFIEKPLTHTLDQAKKLMVLAQQKGLKVQVGHVERFNPALLSVADMKLNPRFIEAHRLANFNPRGTDVSVVLDLMIHDLDIVLSMIDSKVDKVSASGVSLVSNSPDICNARIEFENGSVANLTASRLSVKQMRKIRIFQDDAYISLDFLEKTAQVIRLYDNDNVENYVKEQLQELDTPKGKKFLHIDMPSIEPVNAIKLELETFAQSIMQNTTPTVPISDGYKALELAQWIMDEMQKSQRKFT